MSSISPTCSWVNSSYVCKFCTAPVLVTATLTAAAVTESGVSTMTIPDGIPSGIQYTVSSDPPTESSSFYAKGTEPVV